MLLRLECSGFKSFARAPGKTNFSFLHQHFYVFNLVCLLVLDITSAGKCFLKYIVEKDSNATKQATSFSGVPLLSLGAVLPRSVSVAE